MSHKKRPVLLAVLLLKTTSGIAQSQPTPPPPDYERASVPLPRAVTLLAGVRMLFTRDEGPDKMQLLIDHRRAHSEKCDRSPVIRVQRNKLTRSLGLVD